MPRFGDRVGVSRALAGLAAVAVVIALPGLARLRAGADARARLVHVAGVRAVSWCGPQPALAMRTDAGAGALAGWQTIGGCGAGASSGTGGGVKWVGRNVRGGLFHVECQANYVEMPYGYNFVGTTLVSADLGDKWNVGASVPYLYKYMSDPYELGIDLANKGPGDVTLLGTRRFGATNAWNLTLGVGLPTGTSEVEFRMDPLPQDRQLGLGKPTASLTLDHTLDNLWGPVVLGGNLNYRGGENKHGSYRAPTGSLYAYASYLLGPFAPAAGVSVTGYVGDDRNRLAPQSLPRASVAANLSLEWAMDEVAFLIGASLPYDFSVITDTTDQRRNRVGFWTLALGVAFAPL